MNMEFMRVKGSNNLCTSSTLLYNYQFVFIQSHSTPSIGSRH